MEQTSGGGGLFEGHSEGMEEDHPQSEYNWRVTAPDKWDVIASGNWIQKAVWNRMVTTLERDQPHKTPVTSTWTVDFLTREGEDRKVMGDWLRDKTISWKARRRLLQTNAGTFPCEVRLQKWGKHPDGICGLCKRSREMGLKLLGGKPARGTTGHLQNSVCRLQAPAATGAHNACFQLVQDDMSKTRSVSTERVSTECVKTGNLSRRGLRSRWEGLYQNISHHSRSTPTRG